MITMLRGQESRVWTSQQGSTIEARLQKLEPAHVTLQSKENKVLRLAIADLSLVDRIHLIESANAPETILAAGEMRLTEKFVKVDESAWKKLPTKFALGESSSVGEFEQWQTPHFLVVYAGDVKAPVVAETAERLWLGMAATYPQFRSEWGEKRRVIFVIEDAEAYQELGDWYGGLLAEKAQDAESQLILQQHKSSWPQLASAVIELPQKMADEGKYHSLATVIRAENGRSWRKAFPAMPTHALASDLMKHWFGPVRADRGVGYFALATGQGYYKEIQLAGLTETMLVEIGGSGGDEISTKSGFENGSAWPRLLKSGVKRGKITPKLADIYGLSPDGLTAENLVLMHSLMHYCQSTPKRLAAFARLTLKVRENQGLPTVEEMAKIYGFDSATAMEEDWINYLKSSEFK